uniref:Putative secreted protein n=1 Tax=Ixodes ricinus TaxID=34613 RepID=A0A6B0U3N8_IXORI
MFTKPIWYFCYALRVCLACYNDSWRRGLFIDSNHRLVFGYVNEGRRAQCQNIDACFCPDTGSTDTYVANKIKKSNLGVLRANPTTAICHAPAED